MASQCPRCSAPIADDSSYCIQCGAPTPTVLSGVRGGPVAPPPEPPPVEEPVDARLARALGAGYELRGLVGRGGFALVYEVWDRQLERRLAVKVLDPEVSWTSGMLARFRQEARTLAKLQHPAILGIHFVGEGNGLNWYTMPFVEGDALSALIRKRGALSGDEAVAVARPVLEALEHAHGAGLVHRDIKPDNILVERETGRVLLVDFGIAKLLAPEAASHKTATGFTVGTPHYMSPEQALGQGQLDGRSDLYALGATLFQLVTGTPPFDGESSQEIVGKHVLEPVKAPADLDARVPRWLSDVIVRCLAKKPADRYQSAAEVLRAIDEGSRWGGSGSARGSVTARLATASGGAPDDRGSPQPAAVGERSRREEPIDRGREPTGGALEHAPAAPSGAPATGKRRHSTEPRGGGPRWGPIMGLGAVVLGLGAAMVVAVWWLLTAGSPSLVVRNALVEPAEILVNGIPADTIAAGEQAAIALARGEVEQVSWRLIRPTMGDGTPLGEEMADVFPTPPSRSKRTEATIRAVVGGQPMVAPLVTNPSNRDLTAVINVGTAAAVACGCVIPARGQRTHLGYYHLFQNSRIRVYDASSGARGRFLEVPDLAELADAISGAALIEIRAAEPAR